MGLNQIPKVINRNGCSSLKRNPRYTVEAQGQLGGGLPIELQCLSEFCHPALGDIQVIVKAEMIEIIGLGIQDRQREIFLHIYSHGSTIEFPTVTANLHDFKKSIDEFMENKDINDY